MKVRSLIGSNSATRIAVSVAIAWALATAGAMAPATASASGVPLAPVFPATFIANAQVLVTAPVGFAATSTPLVTLTPSPVLVALRPVAAKPAKKRAKKLTIRQKVARVGRAKGLSKAEVSALLWICKRESNFHPTSKSSAGCRGLFQLSHGMTAGHPWKQPTWNTTRAIKYMKGRYHGVLRAKAFWRTHHWY